MFQYISKQSEDEKNHYVEMEEEHEDLAFQDIGIIPHKFITINITDNKIDESDGFLHKKTLYDITTRIKETTINFKVSRRFKEFKELYEICVKLPNVVLSEMPEKKAFNRFDDKVIEERKNQFQILLCEMLEHGQIYANSFFREFLGIPKDFSLLRVLASHRHILNSVLNSGQGIAKNGTQTKHFLEYELPIVEWSHEDLMIWMCSRDMHGLIDVFENHPEWNGEKIWNFAITGDKDKLVGITPGRALNLFNHLRQVHTFQRAISEQKNIEKTSALNVLSESTLNESSLIYDKREIEEPKLFGGESFDISFDFSNNLKLTSNSSSEVTPSSLSGSDAFPNVERCEYLPPIDRERLSELELKRVRLCIDKLRKIDPYLSERAYIILSQNLVIAERLLFLKINPYIADPLLVDPSSTIQQPLKRKITAPYVKLKLIITELSDTTVHRLQRSLAHKFGKVNQEYGYFHAALVFGAFYLEWTDNSIVTIRSRSSSKAVLAYDIHTFRGQESINNAITSLGDLICKWNGEMTYSNDKCNCQHFVTQVLQTLGVENRLSGSLKLYFQRLKNDGYCKMEFQLSESLKKIFPSQKSIQFKTHKELDEFYMKVQEKLPKYFLSAEGMSDELLLKAFDRAFWLRLASSQRKEEYLPLRNERGENSCPFNPLEKSFSEICDNSIIGGDYNFGNYVPLKPKQRNENTENEEYYPAIDL